MHQASLASLVAVELVLRKLSTFNRRHASAAIGFKDFGHPLPRL